MDAFLEEIKRYIISFFEFELFHFNNTPRDQASRESRYSNNSKCRVAYLIIIIYAVSFQAMENPFLLLLVCFLTEWFIGIRLTTCR